MASGAAECWLVTFRRCGHVQQYPHPPAPGQWVSGWGPLPTGCQAQCQVESVKPCEEEAPHE